MKKMLLMLALLLSTQLFAQKKPLAPTPPMGFMTWNFFGVNINEQDIRSLADALVSSGLKDAGFDYIFIDDGWQGGRDAQNNMIPDAKKFPSGMKALCDYVHKKGLKIGIYSDAATLTCAGYTASLGFEEQDAKTFAAWGFDYLKYDYCHAPTDWQTAIARYTKMADALKKSGRDIVFGVCEWGDRQPWLWAKKSGGHLWRTTADVRDKWERKKGDPKDPNAWGWGIMDIINVNAKLHAYAGPDAWNDPDMLVVGLYGKKGAPSSDLGGTGCTDTEYQTQMSLWCMMASPLMITCDVRNMNEVTKKILLNKDIIAIDQDVLGKQAERVIENKDWQVFVKPLANGDIALAVLNVGDKTNKIQLNLAELGIVGKSRSFDVWTKVRSKTKNKLSLSVNSHETKVFRFSK